MTGGRARSVRGLARGALAALLVLLAAVVFVALFAAHRLHTTADERFVEEAFPLRAAARDLVVQLLNQETGVRGYVITGDPASLGPYRRGRANAAEDLEELERGAAGRPRLASALADVRREVSSVEAYFARQIARVRSGPAGRRRAQLLVPAGTAPFDRFRVAAARLDGHVDDLVRSARAQQRRTFRRTVAFLLVAGLAAGAIAVVLLLAIPSRLDRLYRREQQARLEAERGARASRALAHVREAVVLADEDDVVRYWNAAAERVLGVPEADAVGRPLADVVSGLAGAADTGVVPFVHDGDERRLAVTTTRFPEGRVVVLRDVTEEEAVARMRDDFVTTAAHELRTPIAVVYGAARTLGRRDVELPPETGLRLVGVIESESERLGRIVEQILTSDALDRGELTLELTACDVPAVCESVVRSLEPWRPANVALGLVVDDGAGATARCDEEHLRQALLGVAENAVKYSPDGGRVELRVADGAGRVRIEVRDEGIGVPAAERERVFEKFYRLDPALRRGVGGSGLGLSIARRLIEEMDGTVALDANPGGGTVVTIELPRA